MVDKVPIELTPSTALRLWKFLSEFENDFNNDERLTAIKNSYQEFRNEVMNKIRNDQIDDALKDLKINKALGYEPSK